MIQVSKKRKETTLSLMKRFSRKIKQSGAIASYKNRQFKNRKKSHLKKKETALKKLQTQERLTKLYKLGKLERFAKK